MHRVPARVRVIKLAVATSTLSVGIVASATPTAIHPPDVQAILTAVAPELETRQLAPGSVQVGEAVDSVRIVVAPKGDLARLRNRNLAAVEDLPASGHLATFDLAQPHDPAALPPLAFVPRQVPAPAAEQIRYSAFSKPAARNAPTVVVAQAPEQRRPASAGARGGRSVAVSPVLAYAPATSGLDAPFDAVLGGTPPQSMGEEGAFVPRPRPDPEKVLTWLEGRALGQFAPGQHDWVTNPLPASVHEAKQQKCLAEAIYFEARSESEEGQAGVAQVILNRVRNPAYPDTICAVVYQNKNWRNRCQFSFACDGIKDRIRSRESYETAERIAKDVTEGRIWLDEVGDSTHYHANYVSPRWKRAFRKMEKIGAHIFYRTRLGGWS